MEFDLTGSEKHYNFGLDLFEDIDHEVCVQSRFSTRLIL